MPSSPTASPSWKSRARLRGYLGRKLERYQSRRRWTSLTREGWYFLIILAFIATGAILRDINLMLLMAGTMVGLLLLNFRNVHVALRTIQVERHAPRVVAAGAPLLVEIAVKNSNRWGVKRAVVIEDRLQLQGQQRRQSSAPTAVFFSRVDAHRRERRAYRGSIARRGRYRLGPLRATCRYPLGLVQRTVTLGQRDELIVYPRLGQLTRAWQRLREHSVAGHERSGRPKNLAEGDFYALRGWRSGDSHRWIHWRTSARRDELVVRQFEEQRRPDLTLVLDLWQPNRPSYLDEDRVELAVRFAATVVADLCDHGGGHLQLWVLAERLHTLRGTTSAALEREALKLLAVAEAGQAQRVSELLGSSEPRPPRGTPLVLLTTRPAEQLESGALATKQLADHLSASCVTVLSFCSGEWKRYFNAD